MGFSYALFKSTRRREVGRSIIYTTTQDLDWKGTATRITTTIKAAKQHDNQGKKHAHMWPRNPRTQSLRAPLSGVTPGTGGKYFHRVETTGDTEVVLQLSHTARTAITDGYWWSLAVSLSKEPTSSPRPFQDKASMAFATYSKPSDRSVLIRHPLHRLYIPRGAAPSSDTPLYK